MTPNDLALLRLLRDRSMNLTKVRANMRYFRTRNKYPAEFAQYILERSFSKGWSVKLPDTSVRMGGVKYEITQEGQKVLAREEIKVGV